jgi:hypothetical protein
MRPSVRSLLRGLGLALALVGAAFDAHGQRSTEQFIPIGQSPGVSHPHRYSTIGVIADVNAAARTVTIADPAGPRTVRLTDKTRIFLDRSKLRLGNLSGSFADLQKGRLVEVKYLDPERRELADWVKVEISQP